MTAITICQSNERSVLFSAVVMRNKTYVFLRCKPAVFTLAIVAGSKGENSSVLNFFLYLPKESK